MGRLEQVSATALLMSALAVGGCSTTADLFPIAGPLSHTVPLSVLTAKVDGITGNTGGVSLVMPDGETCKGRWSSAAPTYTASTSGSLWDRYGNLAGFSGTTVGIAPGVNRGEAFLACSRGTTIKVEFFTGSGTANGYGLAEDSRGNVFKMLF